MDSLLAKQLLVRMKAKNFSISILEQEAGVKTHAVRNILRGRSKRPSAETLQAIADALDCSIKQILEDQKIFKIDHNSTSQEEVSSHTYKSADLLLEAVKVINEKLCKKKHKPTVRQVLACVEEVYLYSLQKGASAIDQNYADWFIELIVK